MVNRPMCRIGHLRFETRPNKISLERELHVLDNKKINKSVTHIFQEILDFYNKSEKKF